MDQAQAPALPAGERARLQRLQRAEARLAAGSYGRSVHSGQPIPDEPAPEEPSPDIHIEPHNQAR